MKGNINQLKYSFMKKNLIIATFVFMFVSSTMNPSKEERIQKLETEIQIVKDNVTNLENKVRNLETSNKQLQTKIRVLEKR